MYFTVSMHLNFLQREGILKTTLSLFLLFIVTTAYADLSYYPADLTTKINDHLMKDDALKTELFKVISAKQTVLGYDGARKILFGKMFLKNDSNGYFITDVYCKKRFGANAGVGKDTIPEGTQINCEHTWPQSKFTNAFPNEMQKSDLHHLFPSDSKANSIRGNDNFTDVSQDTGKLASNCQDSKYGKSVTGHDTGFEPPLTHKGNVARALFYFSVRYKITIPKNEIDTLRRWNDLDPVDQEEMDQNEMIQQVQGNRNPFIDFPNLDKDINQF